MQKPIKEIEAEAFCPYCGTPGERKFVPSRLYLVGTRVEHAEYNPGLGCVVKSKYERAEIAKRKGMVEVGNDYKSGDKMQDVFDKDRERKRLKRWEED